MFQLIFILTSIGIIFYRYLTDPLGRIPGPLFYRLSKWRLAIDDFRACRTRTIHSLHAEYGPIVRVGPSEISFASLSALRQIYGAGSGFERTDFYRMFDVYGRQNLFTFASADDHGRRKKMLHHVYSKGAILNSAGTAIQTRVQQFLQLVDEQSEMEIYAGMLFYSLDNITHFLYGSSGATRALMGDKVHQAMLDDLRDPARRKLTWFGTHVRWYVRWLAKQHGTMEILLDRAGLYPQRNPFVYTGIREHALKSFKQYEPAKDDGTIIGLLKPYPELDDLDIASECADHFLAGINTTSDTLLFLLWIISRPVNAQKQRRLIQELRKASLDEIPSPKSLVGADIPYFNAVLHETLRLYAPLPASEPRVQSRDVEIDGFLIPAGTVVSSQVYTLHRNPQVFEEPDEFIPERWLTNDPELKRWWWAFSSGGRMCIGEQYLPLLTCAKIFLVWRWRRYRHSSPLFISSTGRRLSGIPTIPLVSIVALNFSLTHASKVSRFHPTFF